MKRSKSPDSPIRVFWGENYSKKPKVILKAINQAVKEQVENIHLYPAALYEECVNLIANKHKIKPEQVILGHGIEGLIHLTTNTLLKNKKDKGAMFDPSFFVFGKNIDRFSSIKIPCDLNNKIDEKKLVKQIKGSKVFFIASPNTATGNYLLNKKQIEYVLKNYSGILVVDECYYGIGRQSVMSLIKKHKNLLVYRGLTKVMGLGSLRLAYAVGNKMIIDKLNYHFRVIELDPINGFSLEIFKSVFQYYDLMAETTRKFFSEFITFMQKQFPDDTFIQNVTTFHFMDISRYKVKIFEVINFMNEHGYLFEDHQLKSDKEVRYQDYLMLTPPPKEYWKDITAKLKQALES